MEIDWNKRSNVSDSAIKIVMATAIGYQQAMENFRKLHNTVPSPEEEATWKEFWLAVQVLKGQLGIDQVVRTRHGSVKVERRW